MICLRKGNRMERILECNKSLLIDEKLLIQIKDIYQIIGQKPTFTIFTKDNAKYKFSSVDDLIKYDFDEDVALLVVENLQYNVNNILFKFQIIPHYILNYASTSICKYSVEDNSFDSVLKEKILKMYKNHIKSDWLIGKLSLQLFTLILSILLLFIIMIIYFHNPSLLSVPINPIFIIGILVGILLSFVIRMIDRFICNTFFTPIVYYLGFQKNKWERILKLRENIFWVIIIGIVISLISTVITNNIFK